jgi:hypothetical protein
MIVSRFCKPLRIAEGFLSALAELGIIEEKISYITADNFKELQEAI